MQAELENYKSNELDLKVSEDISILYIVQHELLNEKEVEFAGVVLKHQLKEEFSFRIVTKNPSRLIFCTKHYKPHLIMHLKLKI